MIDWVLAVREKGLKMENKLGLGVYSDFVRWEWGLKILGLMLIVIYFLLFLNTHGGIGFLSTQSPIPFNRALFSNDAYSSDLSYFLKCQAMPAFNISTDTSLSSEV